MTTYDLDQTLWSPERFICGDSRKNRFRPYYFAHFATLRPCDLATLRPRDLATSCRNKGNAAILKCNSYSLYKMVSRDVDINVICYQSMLELRSRKITGEGAAS